MGKLVVLFLISIQNLYSFSPENYFQDDMTLIDTLNFKASGKLKEGTQDIRFGKFLKDPNSRINDAFNIPKDLDSRVKFWFKVYTQHTSSQSVLHDINNLALIYDVIDFTELTKSILNKNTKYGLQNKAMRGVVKKYNAAFSKLSKGKCTENKCIRILESLKKANIKLPSSKKRKAFFKGLAKNLRSQTGQKNHIKQGLKNLRGYNESIQNLFKIFNLPKELIAISFLESSFNIHAKSKVGATGPWQFMRVIGKHFLRITKLVDQRSGPLVSSAGALHLLAQNKKIMKSWDLAVNAYNSGTGLMRRGIKRLKKRGFKNIRVGTLIKHFKHPNWGFAAKNFYSEFLALVYTLNYRDLIFKEKVEMHDGKIDFYLTKCSIALLKVIPKLKSTKHNLRHVNNHLKRRKSSTRYPKGTLFMSDVKLTKNRYFKVDPSKLRRRYPKNLYKLVNNQSCSKR
jgi:membrane-bound lytic murein transglycosylase D